MLRAFLGLVWGLALALLFLLPFAAWLGNLVGGSAGTFLVLLFVIVGLAGAGFIGFSFGRNDRRILWPLALVSLWGLIWLLYTPDLVFPGPRDKYGQGPSAHEVFLFFAPEDEANHLLSDDDYSSGGVYESLPLAAAIGGILCGIALLMGRRFTHLRLAVLLAFVASYLIALVLLWTVVSPALWGQSLSGRIDQHTQGAHCQPLGATPNTCV